MFFSSFVFSEVMHISERLDSPLFVTIISPEGPQNFCQLLHPIWIVQLGLDDHLIKFTSRARKFCVNALVNPWLSPNREKQVYYKLSARAVSPL